jgi:hypothetical protein
MIPQTLEEAINLTKNQMDAKFVQAHSEREIVANYHHSLGQFIRNSWGFWLNSPLKQELVKLGLSHPDDMSGLILQCAIRDMKGADRDIEGTVKRYQDYWTNLEKHGCVAAFEIFESTGG